MAYRDLRPRIVGRDGRAITVVMLTEEAVAQGDPQKYVHRMDIQEWKRRAAARVSKRADA